MIRVAAVSWSVDVAGGAWAKDEQCNICNQRKAQYVAELSISWPRGCSADKLTICETCHSEMREAFGDGMATVRVGNLA